MSDPQFKVLLDERRIAERIAELAAEIRSAYGDERILCVGVLKGSFVFMSDLVRALPGELDCAFLGVSSYEGTDSTGAVRITHDLDDDIEGRHVLIVEDIVDTGLTMSYLLRTLRVRKPASLKVAALLDKPSRRKVPVPVDFVGFQIPDAFVIGYGLDLDQRFRNLPYIGIYEPERDTFAGG